MSSSTCTQWPCHINEPCICHFFQEAIRALRLKTLFWFSFSKILAAMAFASASFSVVRVAAPPSWNQKQVVPRFSGLKAVSFGQQRFDFPSFQSSQCTSGALKVVCAAKPETLNKVCDIVKSQLALSDDKPLTPESKFSDLGADSLDTVEIVMALEEEFKISVEEENAGNITTVQEAADLIERLSSSS